MIQRSRPQKKTDDLAFPVRIKMQVPPDGLGNLLIDAHVWLQAEMTALDYAVHSGRGIGCDAVAFYFRTIEAAQRFANAFPELQLADDTISPVYSRPMPR